MPFTFEKLIIADVIYIESKIFTDSRGYFAELFKSDEFKKNGVPDAFVQFNLSRSGRNVLRGLHYQKPPKAQGKLMTVADGEIFDAAVDIRRESPTYGKWVGKILSSEKRNMMYVPPGFAHGFCVLSEEATVIYYCTDYYSPDDERGVMWNDPAVAIDWPVKNPTLAGRDASYPSLEEADNNF